MIRAGVFALLLACGALGCNISVSDVCEERIPELDRKLDDALASLAPWTPEYPERVRALASVDRGDGSDGTEAGIGAGPAELSSEDRASWEKWAEGHLFQTQRYYDVVQGEGDGKALRQDLTEISNLLVTFHGYTHAGRVDRMVATLRKMQAQVARTRRSACTSPALPASAGASRKS